MMEMKMDAEVKNTFETMNEQLNNLSDSELSELANRAEKIIDQRERAEDIEIIADNLGIEPTDEVRRRIAKLIDKAQDRFEHEQRRLEHTREPEPMFVIDEDLIDEIVAKFKEGA